MPDRAQNTFTDLIDSAKDLGQLSAYQPTTDPLNELERLLGLANDLTVSDSALEEQISSGGDPVPPEKKPLRFESRACGSSTPVIETNDGRGAKTGDLEPSSLDQTFGTELLRTLAGKPLAPEARIEALRRLTLAMANPTRQNLESVLMILVTNDVDAGQRPAQKS